MRTDSLFTVLNQAGWTLLGALALAVGGCDSEPVAQADSGTPEVITCIEAGTLFDTEIQSAASSYQTCTVDADCVLRDVAHTCGDGSNLATCPVAVNVSESSSFGGVVDAAGSAICSRLAGGCDATPTCVSGTVAACEGGMCVPRSPG